LSELFAFSNILDDLTRRGAVAVGKGGVHIGGNVSDSTILTGNNDKVGKGKS
jgi:hypothetical protein